MVGLDPPAFLNAIPRPCLCWHSTIRIPAPRPAVLFYNGSFAPAHRGHVDALVRARDHLEASGEYRVAGAFVSPAHASYVARKLGRSIEIATAHRVALLRCVRSK